MNLKKLFTFLATICLCCVPVMAVGNATASENMAISPALCIPFAGLLLCIAVFPLVKAEWWERHQAWVVAFWSLLFLIPFGVIGGAGTALETALECIVADYLTFIVLLFGLFCVAGNITLEGDLAGSPRVNVALLLFGTLLSSWVGTTGASMLMVRPMIKMNSWRKRKRHIMVFFIFLISNIGGCLTPIGDPPLLMGFARGVPFFWSLRLFPVMVLNVAILLTVFYFVDMRAYRKDIAMGRKPDISKPGTDVHINGLHNLIFLVMIVAAVILSGTLPTMPMFQNAEGEVLGIHIFGEKPDGTASDWYYDIANKAFWAQVFPASHRPVAACWMILNGVGTCIFRGTDGHWRHFDDETAKDDGVDFDSCVAIGPIRTGMRDDIDGMVGEVDGVLAAGSSNVSLEIYSSDSPEGAVIAAQDPLVHHFEAQLSAGRNKVVRPRQRGAWAVFVIKASGRWGYESILTVMKHLGRLR